MSFNKDVVSTSFGSKQASSYSSPGIDVLCPGQHPRETREFINETRCEYGLEDLEPEAVVFSELEEDAQLEMCETELENTWINHL